MIAVVLCHGRKHRKIAEVNYNKSAFIDANHDSEPDYVRDLGYPLNTKVTYNNVIDASCPLALQLHKMTIDESIGIPINGKLNNIFINNVLRLLSYGGFLYSKSVFFSAQNNNETSNDNLYIDKLYSYGLNYIGNKTLKFDKDLLTFLVFKKGKIPTRNELYIYLLDVIKTRLHTLHYIDIYYYSDVFSTELKSRVIIDDNFTIDKLLPYKNLDSDDEDFVASDEQIGINELIHLSYTMLDTTKVVLF